MAQFGTPQGGLNFQFSSPNANTTGGFGATATSGTGVGLFGTPTSTTNQGTGLQFGLSNTPNTGTGFTLGATSSATNLFNSNPPANTSLNFGANTTTTNTGLFGASTTTPKNTLFGTPAPAGNLSLNATTTGGGLTGFSLGGMATTASTGFSLGAPSTQAAPATSLQFNTPASSGLGAFGTSATTTTGTLSFGGAATTSASTGLFGMSAAPATGFGLGGTSTTSFLGKPATTLSAPVQNVGLGGIPTSQPKPGAVAPGITDVAPKDQPLPAELKQTVEQFKNFVKQQKTHCSDIARTSIKDLRKVEEEIDAANNMLNEVEKHLQYNRAIAEKLKIDAAKGLQHIEMAQRTFDTPPGLQYDNTAPLQFFTELVDGFEREMQSLKVQIENTDKYVRNTGKPTPLTSQDLTLGMRRLHDTFVSLAGRLQSVHSQVEVQKEQYLNLRKYLINDDTNVFEASNKATEALNMAIAAANYVPPNILTGPTPFNPLTNQNVAAQSIQAQLAPPAYPGSSTGQGAPLTTGLTGTNLSSFNTQGGLGLGQSFSNPNTSVNFQLQKPPVGNKRSK